MAIELPRLAERVAKIEGVLEQIGERLNHIETELSELRGELREIRKGQWRIVWIVIGTWITVLVTILLKK